MIGYEVVGHPHVPLHEGQWPKSINLSYPYPYLQKYRHSGKMGAIQAWMAFAGKANCYSELVFTVSVKEWLRQAIRKG